MLKKDFDKQREKVVVELNKRFAYWEFSGDLFDKPKKKLIEFYKFSISLERKTDSWMGRFSESMKPVYPLKMCVIFYTQGSTYLYLFENSIPIYDCISRDDDIRRL